MKRLQRLSQKQPGHDEPETIKSRLKALIDAIVEESSFDPMIKRVVSKMILNFLSNASDESIQQKIEELRDKVIPFILYGDDHAETQNTHKDR